MKGDFTRFTHQPARGYTGVLMQQGRVTLDADWNEQVAIDAHRRRLGTLDVIGYACAPEDAPGFGIHPTPDGEDLVITPGRFYLDGRLVELGPGEEVPAEHVDEGTLRPAHLALDGRPLADGQWLEVADGSGAVELARIAAVDAAAVTVDADLGGLGEELTIRRVVTYRTQPFAPPPLGEPFTPGEWRGESHVVYLDVWERHVTAVEDPDLREVALGGPDTATRVQLAWAVRILRGDDDEPVDVGAAGCADPLPEWDQLVAPAAGCLTARAEEPEDPLNPCVVPAGAGYRGLENRLYRVEIHDAGPLGEATFKWSRDNGSVVSAIRAFVPGTPFRVEVASLGRDRELRFRSGDVVEVDSDQRDLGRLPGLLAEVDGQPDEARRLVPLDADVSAAETEARPRLRRWDHEGPPAPTTGDWVPLEKGIEVRFGGGPFRTGDYWVIPARTATGDVEGFVEAAPRGIDHAYTRLALVTWEGDATEVRDCRSTFPTLCHPREAGHRGCCTITVGDGVASHGDVDRLDDAVARAAEHVGPVRICLLPGEHRVGDTVVLRRSEVTITGCGAQAPVTSSQGGVLRIERALAVRLERLVLRSSAEEPTVAALGVRDLTVEGCEVVNGVASPAVGRPEAVVGGRGVEGEATGITTRAPVFRAREHEEGTAVRGPAVAATAARRVVVRGCRLAGPPALVFQGQALECVDNLVHGGIVLADGTDTVEVRDNVIGGSPEMGVQLGIASGGGSGELRGTGAFTAERMVLERGPGVGIADVQISGNRITGCGRAGVGTGLVLGAAGTAEVSGLVITDNVITRCGTAPLLDWLWLGGGVLLQQASDVEIARNVIADNGPRDVGQGFAVAAGVAVYDCHGLTIRHNRVVDNVAQGAQEGIRAAVGVVGAMVAADESPDDERAVPVDRAAATVEGNEIRVAGGPGVALYGVGPMTVSHNHLVSRYEAGTYNLPFGRAIMVGNLGAGSDTGFGVGARQFRSPVLHGPVQLHGNQVLVEDLTGRLSELPRDRETGEELASQLLAGSAVLAFGYDDLSIQDNQIANRTGDGATRIAASVWALGATLRAGGNRFSEVAGAALYSYVGYGVAAHVATGNIATHCLRVEGAQQAAAGNIELACRRAQPFERIAAVFRAGQGA